MGTLQMKVSVIICFFSAQQHYRLIVYNCGFCPGLMLASCEPQAMKSTAAMVALKAIGDPSAFLELNSTTEYVDMFRDCTSLPQDSIDF